MMDEVLKQLSVRFDTMCAKVGRESIPPEQLLRAQHLQAHYSVRSERLLMEEIDYNPLFRWFVGLNADNPGEHQLPAIAVNAAPLTKGAA